MSIKMSVGLVMYDYVSKPAVVASTSIFCGLAILCNLSIILIIFLSRLRSSWKYLIVLNISIVGLYDACAVTAFAAQLDSLEYWTHDTIYFRYLDFDQYSILNSVKVTLLTTICCLEIMNMFVSNKRILTLMSASMIFASAFYSFVLVLPSKMWEGITSERFVETVRLRSLFALYDQASILFVLVIELCIVSCCCRRSFDVVTSAGVRRMPIDVIVASAAFLAYLIAFKIVGFYFSSCSGREECQLIRQSKTVTLQWQLVGHLVLPLIWLLCPDVQREMTRICGPFRSHPPPANNVRTHSSQIDLRGPYDI